MWLVLSFLRRRGADILVVLFILACVIILTGPVVQAGLDRNQRCVSNVGRIVTGLSLYIEDYDERVPSAVPMSNYAVFQSILLPYVKDGTVFRCPSTRNSPYRPNAALANQKLSSFPDLDSLEILRDSRAHSDLKLTIAFLDGHVERGHVVQKLPLPDVTCLVHEIRIRNALRMYSQDYDEVYPFYPSDSDFRQALQPYVRSQRTWRCPDSNRFYVLSKDIRGKTQRAFPDLSPIVVVDDPIVHRSGIKTTVYLDTYLEQRGPNGIAFPSAFGESRRRIHRLATAYAAYVQDHDLQLPIYSSYEDLAPQLFPYVRASRTLQSPGELPFEANTALSGTRLSDYPHPKSVIVLRDNNRYVTYGITVGYLDGSFGTIAP